MKILILNYGIGNLISVKNMLKKAGATDVLISSDPQEIKNADKKQIDSLLRSRYNF